MVSQPHGRGYRYAGSWSCAWEADILEEAHGICVDNDGDLLIADPRQGRVVRFTPKGDYVGEVGRGKGTADGFFDSPRDVRVDTGGRIFTLDSGRCRTSLFKPSGEFQVAWGSRGTGPGQLLRPHTLALFNDLVYIVDVDNSRVNAYATDGRLARSWGRKGTQVGEFLAPNGIACDPRGDIFVVEYAGRCQKFDPRDTHS